MPDLETDVIAAVVSIVRPVAGLQSVFDYFPQVVAGDEQPAAFVWVNHVDETRHSLGGPSGGRKYVDYDVVVEVRGLSYDPQADTKGWYALVNAIRKVLRRNQTLGGLVTRFGEDLTVEYDEPQNEQTTTRFAATITGRAREEVTG